MAKRRKKKEPRALDGKLKQVIDPTVAKALSHPFRGHILVTLGGRIASPKEIADELGIDPRDLDYHIKVLIGVGMIRLVRTEKRRGAREHFYELESPLIYIDDREWRQMPEPIQSSFSAGLLRAVMDEAVEALVAGTFHARDNHQSRTQMILDEQGCTKLMKLMEETLGKVLEIREDSAKNLDRTESAGIPIEVYMMGFETAAAVRQKSDSAVAADA
jgi:DNA-binding transcriptional ArsR family regulator